MISAVYLRNRPYFQNVLKSKDLLWQSKWSMIWLRWPHLNLKASANRGGAAKVLCKLPTDPKPQMMVNTLSFMRVTYILYTLSFLKVFSFPIVDWMSCPKLRRSMLEIVFRGKKINSMPSQGYMKVMRKALHAVNHVTPINHVPGKWKIYLPTMIP